MSDFHMSCPNLRHFIHTNRLLFLGFPSHFCPFSSPVHDRYIPTIGIAIIASTNITTQPIPLSFLPFLQLWLIINPPYTNIIKIPSTKSILHIKSSIVIPITHNIISLCTIKRTIVQSPLKTYFLPQKYVKGLYSWQQKDIINSYIGGTCNEKKS